MNLENLKSLVNKGAINNFLSVLSFLIRLITERQLSNELVSSVDKYLKDNLSTYFDTLYVFKNDDIFLIDQPIFGKIKKVVFEMDKRVNRVEKTVEFISRKLENKQFLESLSLKFSDCTLVDKDIAKILRAVKSINNLQNVFFDFSENNLSDDLVPQIGSSLENKRLIALELGLNK